MIENPEPGDLQQSDRLRGLDLVRERAWTVLAMAERDESQHFALDAAALGRIAADLARKIKANHGDSPPPFDNCWQMLGRHSPDTLDRLGEALRPVEARERARSGFDLALLSVALDPAGEDPERLESVADMFMAGAFSSDPDRPLMLDAVGLGSWLDDLATGDGEEDLVEGRRDALRRLGAFQAQLATEPLLFGRDARFGRLLDALVDELEGAPLKATRLAHRLHPVAARLAAGPVRISGQEAGDVWRLPVLRSEEHGRDLVPFHALLQRLVVALVEPLAEAGIELGEIEYLCAPATRPLCSRMLRLGLVVPRHSTVTRLVHPPGSDIVVELRAITVALLDRLSDRVRAELGLTAGHLPVVRLLGALEAVAADVELARGSERVPDIAIAPSVF